MYLLSALDENCVRYAPLCYHSFAPRLREKQKPLPQGANLGERLKWLRINRGLRQIDVAQAADLSRNGYIHLETGVVDHIERDAADRLMAFYGVDEETLLDEYNRFLYRGQGSTILELRRKVRMGKKTFAKFLGVSDSSIRAWEAERVRISKKSWKRHFKE